MTRSLVLALVLIVLFAGQQSQPKCTDIVGTWKWFVGPELTIKADHTFSNGENSGTWEVTSVTERKYTLDGTLGALSIR